MVRLFLSLLMCGISATFCYSQPSLPSIYQSKTISSSAGADIFVRWAGKGPVVVLIHGYAEKQRLLGPVGCHLPHHLIIASTRLPRSL